ncbi:MAG: hypothetical protein VKO64_03800 [Candidatus Sericytochromatia bacterium]|nr:hypothetical protein [Candidatus Sericytochromatia bacterium]
MEEPVDRASGADASLADRIAAMPTYVFKVLAAAVALGSAVAIGAVLWLLAGDTGPESWKSAIPDVLAPWLYSPALLPLLVALLARTRATIAAAVAAALCAEVALVLPAFELLQPSVDAQSGLVVLFAPLPALFVQAVVLLLVRRWGRRAWPEGRIIR